MSLMMAPSFSTSKSKSPVSHRKRGQHPTPPQPPTFDLMKYIPDPDDAGDESEVEIPEWMAKRQKEPPVRSPKRKKQPLERSPKRLKAEGPAFTRIISMDRSPNANRTPRNHGFKAVNGKKSPPRVDNDSDEDVDEEDTSSSDEKSYRETPVNMSTPKFNSNNIKLAKQGYDISDNESESSESLDFSSKPKANNAPNNSRFEYDDAIDLSSGEETSIPDTISRSKSDGSQGSQKIRGGAVSEVEETDSDDNLGARSYTAVRSSGLGMLPSTKSVYGNRTSYLKARKEQANARKEETTEFSEESTEEQSGRTDSEEESPPAAPTEEEPTEESIPERASRAVSEEVPAAAQRTEVLDPGASASSDESKKGTTESGNENAAEESPDESEGPRADSSDSDEDAPPPQSPRALDEEAKTQSQSKKQRPRPTSVSQSSQMPRVRKTKDAPSSKAKQGPARLGRLAAREDQILNDTIERFLPDHGLTDEKVPSLVKGEIEDTDDARTLHHEFWKAVYDAFPNRSPRYVRAIVKRRHIKYSPRGKWNEEEDSQLKELAEKHREDRNKWLIIGKILDRTPVECRDRHRNYALCGSSRKTGPWKAKDIRWLLHAVSKFIPEDEEKGDLPDGTNYKIEWLEVSAAMEGRRSRQQCLAKWKTMDVNPRKLRVRKLLHGRGPQMSPELRIVLMQVYSTPEYKLWRFVQAVSEYEAVGELPIPWRKLQGGQLTKELRVETLNIIWMRLRKGFEREVEGKSDQEAARSIYELAIEDPGRLPKEVERQDGDTEAEQAVVEKPWKGLSTNASFGRRE